MLREENRSKKKKSYWISGNIYGRYVNIGFSLYNGPLVISYNFDKSQLHSYLKLKRKYQKEAEKNLFSKLKSTCWQIYDSIKINKENGNSSGKLCKTICVNNNKRKILSRIKDRCNIWWVYFLIML